MKGNKYDEICIPVDLRFNDRHKTSGNQTLNQMVRSLNQTFRYWLFNALEIGEDFNRGR